MQYLVSLCLALGLLIGAASAEARIITQPVDYRAGDTALQGYLAYDDAVAGKRPGVLVIHEYWGLNQFAKDRAVDLAEMGFVAFAADMYGKGVVAPTSEEASKLAGQFRGRWDTGGRQEMRDRARAGLAVLQAHQLVDPARLAAIGYCFGGTTALELAYSGAEIRGVVSFHGGLTTPSDADLPNIKASILILHGAIDPTMTPEQIRATQDALTKANADWQMIIYSGAKHSFTNPANKDPNTPVVGYNEKAARRSWQAMRQFFSEVLALE